MKTSQLLSLAIILVSVSTSAFASISDKDAKEADAAREGNLATLALNWYKQNADSTTVDPDDVNQEAATPDYRVIRVDASSSYDPATTDAAGNQLLGITAGYLIIKYSFGGSTHAGADRTILDAVIISADRQGTANPDGSIKATRADEFKRVRSVDPTTLTVFE